MVEVWAMNPTPNSMYMAHQYRLLDCKRGFSANKSRKMVIQMFTISVVFFIFCCKFYTFFYVCMLVHCCAECRMMQRVLQRFGRPFTAIGTDLSCPHIREPPRNGGQKHVFGNVETHIR